MKKTNKQKEKKKKHKVCGSAWVKDFSQGKGWVRLFYRRKVNFRWQTFSSWLGDEIHEDYLVNKNTAFI